MVMYLWANSDFPKVFMSTGLVVLIGGRTVCGILAVFCVFTVIIQEWTQTWLMTCCHNFFHDKSFNRRWTVHCLCPLWDVFFMCGIWACPWLISSSDTTGPVCSLWSLRQAGLASMLNDTLSWVSQFQGCGHQCFYVKNGSNMWRGSPMENCHQHCSSSQLHRVF